MDRLQNLVVGNAAAALSDSPFSSDFNWNNLSVGNDTANCEQYFSRKYFNFFY